MDSKYFELSLHKNEQVEDKENIKIKCKNLKEDLMAKYYSIYYDEKVFIKKLNKYLDFYFDHNHNSKFKKLIKNVKQEKEKEICLCKEGTQLFKCSNT